MSDDEKFGLALIIAAISFFTAVSIDTNMSNQRDHESYRQCIKTTQTNCMRILRSTN